MIKLLGRDKSMGGNTMTLRPMITRSLRITTTTSRTAITLKKRDRLSSRGNGNKATAEFRAIGVRARDSLPGPGPSR